MIIDGILNAFINGVLFLIVVLIVKAIGYNRKKNYTPLYWISIDKRGIKFVLLGIVIALFYKLLLGLICIITGSMIFTIDKSGILASIMFTLVSSFGFLGVALFEEGIFRGYIMQVVLKKLPKLLAIIVQAVVFGSIHYYNYSVLSHTGLRLIDAMLIGLIFGIIVIKTKSLMFVIGAHLFYNTIEQILFVDNSYKFTRFMFFQNSNSLSGLFSIEFVELIMLSIIAMTIIFLFRNDLFRKSMSKG